MPIDSQDGRIRVLLISARADLGGGPRHIVDLLSAFQKVSHNFDLFCASPNQDPYADQFKLLSRSWIEIPVRRFSPLALLNLYLFIKKNKIDIIHSHGRGAGLYSRILGMLSVCRVIHTFHGIHRDPTIIGRLKLFTDQLLAYCPFKAVFVSENEEKEAIRFSVIRKTTARAVIPNAVDLSRFPAPQKFEPRHATPIRIGGFLRADRAKGPDLFIKIVDGFKDRAAWTCAGITRDELQSFGTIPSSLKIAGKLTDPSHWLSSIDVFISTSRAEGLPIGVLEAMASGCICILSNIPAHKVFSESSTAIIFDPHHPTQLEHIFNDIRAGNIVQLVNMQSRARELIETHHSMPAFIRAIIKTYMNT